MTILCVSGSRADYGYLRPIAQALGVQVADFAAVVGNDLVQKLDGAGVVARVDQRERPVRPRGRLAMVRDLKRTARAAGRLRKR